MSTLIGGIYVLLIELKSEIKVNVGSIGKTEFRKGLYAYVGSAQKNLEQRVKRHLRREKKKHWHIDYLLDNTGAHVIGVLYKPAKKKEECNTAKRLQNLAIEINGFGCSDCRCKSHLFQIAETDIESKQKMMDYLPEFSTLNIKVLEED